MVPLPALSILALVRLPETLSWTKGADFGFSFAFLHALLATVMLVTGTAAARTRENLARRVLGGFIGGGLGYLLALAEAHAAGLYESTPAALVGPGIMLPFFMLVAGGTAVVAFGLAGSRIAVERPGGPAHLVLGAWLVLQAGAFVVGAPTTAPALAGGCAWRGPSPTRRRAPGTGVEDGRSPSRSLPRGPAAWTATPRSSTRGAS